MKKFYIVLCLLLVLFVPLVQGCTKSETAAPETTPTPVVVITSTPSAAPTPETPETTDVPAASGKAIFTLEELADYNGENGNPAYVAVDGIVYDVTNVPEWNGGRHNGFTAGEDLTEEIKTRSPHGIAKLNGVPVVGKLAD